MALALRKVILVDGSVECEIPFSSLKKGAKFKLYEADGEPAHGVDTVYEALADSALDKTGTNFVMVNDSINDLIASRIILEETNVI
jgi:hypothetical protein